MQIPDFIKNYKNHPVLFVGTGMSLRYLKNSYSWDELLKKIAFDLLGNDEKYLDLKSNSRAHSRFVYEAIATKLDKEFTKALTADRDGKFKSVNDQFYASMDQGVHVSRLKIYIADLLSNYETKPEMTDELAELKKIGKNVGSIITTNYDSFIENFLDFMPLIGNDILLSNPYGSVYKIHGCTTDPRKIIITEEDYENFEAKYELIRAQLLSLFIHNPIIFLGYSVSDSNIKRLLKTIFTYVDPDSSQAQQIKNNFLLVEYEKGSNNIEITDHDIDIEGFPTIRINKIKTDNYIAIYEALSNLTLAISAMDIRKVQNIVKEIYAGGDIKVKITEDLNSLKNDEKILAIGSEKSITYQYMTSAETCKNYFKILEEANNQLLKLVDKYQINSNQYFPIFAFSKICPDIEKAETLKSQQVKKLKEALAQIEEGCKSCKSQHSTIAEILDDATISPSNKPNAIIWSLLNETITKDDTETYLKAQAEINNTAYRKILCAYDFITSSDGEYELK